MDVFGDSSLFDEFEKERDSKGSFILYERTETGDEDKSKIIFQIGDSDGSESPEDSSSEDQDEKKEDGSDEFEEESDLTADFPNGILRNTKLNKPTEKQTDYKLLHERIFVVIMQCHFTFIFVFSLSWTHSRAPIS